LQASVRKSESSPLALERRLLFSYLAAFAVIFLVAAAVVRFAFVGIIDRQETLHLEDVARAGLRSLLFDNDSLAIDKNEISNQALLTRDQGLQWFDRDGRFLGAEGLTPAVTTLSTQGRQQLTVGQQVFDTVTLPILNPRTHQRVGTVRATEWTEQQRSDIRYLDTGLLIGTLLAVLGSTAGGLALAHRAVRPVERSFQTLREFTADASHELRGPLTAIATSAGAALRDERDPAHDRLRFEAIADGAKQMSRLTNDLLLLAGADRSLERELFMVDLADTLNKLAGKYRARFSEAGVELSVAGEKAGIVYGNPDQIERVLANLLENAVRYTPAGGRVSVESWRDGAVVEVAVRDSGIGIAPERLERIFDRFWRADPVRSPGGSGLGLSIARALARRHGGDVTVTSRYGAGSTFVASFPVRPRSR
jgi:signal transduction histidine kinase